MRVQHGDLVLEKVTDIPKGLKWKKVNKGYIVEKGEGSHLHTTIDECEIAEKDGVLYLRNVATKEFGVDHEEHNVKILELGIWRKGIELEYDAEADEARQTRD